MSFASLTRRVPPHITHFARRRIIHTSPLLLRSPVPGPPKENPTLGAQPVTSGSVKASSPPPEPEISRYALWYRELVPAMIPITLIGSAVYVALQLAQAYLAHEKYTDEARAHIDELEKELDSLKAAPATAVVSASTPGRSERPNSGAGFDFDEVEKDEERRRKKRWWGLGVV